MTDNAGPTTPETPGGKDNEARLVRPEELARLSGPAREGEVSEGSGSPWPVLTVVLATVASWLAVTLTFARTGIDPDLFAFHTANVPWVLVTVGAPATLTIAAGAAGADPRHRGARGLRLAAAVLAAVHLVVLAVIAVIQITKGARASVMADTAFVAVAVLLAAAAIVLGFLGARRAASGGALPLAGLICLLVGHALLAAQSVVLLQGAVGLYIASLLVSTVTPLASLTALWLVVRTGSRTAWTGAAILCLLAVVAAGSLVNVFTSGLSPVQITLMTVQVVFYLAAAAASVMAARAASVTAPVAG